MILDDNYYLPMKESWEVDCFRDLKLRSGPKIVDDCRLLAARRINLGTCSSGVCNVLFSLVRFLLSRLLLSSFFWSWFSVTSVGVTGPASGVIWCCSVSCLAIFIYASFVASLSFSGSLSPSCCFDSYWFSASCCVIELSSSSLGWLAIA